MPVEKNTENFWHSICALWPVTLNHASDYRANGLLSDHIGWTNGL